MWAYVRVGVRAWGRTCVGAYSVGKEGKKFFEIFFDGGKGIEFTGPRRRSPLPRQLRVIRPERDRDTKVMAHGIQTQRDFQFGLKMAWHGFTQVRKSLTGDLFPEIVRVPLTYTLPDGEVREWTGRTVPVSVDDGFPVGTASGESYTLFSPREAMDYLGEVLGGTRYKVESLGMIFDRSRWFVTLDLEELRGIAPAGEAFKLTASGGLDKSQSPMLNLTHVVAVCNNTVQLARNGRALFSSKLTKGFSSCLEASKEAVGEVVGMARIWNETLRGLERVPATVDQSRAVYAADLSRAGADLSSTRAKGLLDHLVAGFRSGRGNSGRTRLDTLNGFTEVFGQGLVGSTSTRDGWSRWESSEFGGFAKRKETFAELVTTGWDEAVKTGEAVLAEAAG